jgi:hypothetical protein
MLSMNVYTLHAPFGTSSGWSRPIGLVKLCLARWKQHTDGRRSFQVRLEGWGLAKGTSPAKVAMCSEFLSSLSQHKSRKCKTIFVCSAELKPIQMSHFCSVTPFCSSCPCSSRLTRSRTSRANNRCYATWLIAYKLNATCPTATMVCIQRAWILKLSNAA